MRQFLAVELSREIRQDLEALQRELRRRLPGWRWLDPSGVHLTLRFLGDVAPELDLQARQGWRAVAAASHRCTIRLEGTGCFPPRGRPRVLWVGVRESNARNRLADLASAIESRARATGFEPLRRRFTPHLTLARAARSDGAATPVDHPFASASTLEVAHLTLFRSELLPSGARYTLLERWPLGAALPAP